MTGLDDAPESVHRAIVAGIVAYFVLIGVDLVVGSPLAAIAAQVLFGFVAIAVGVVLLSETDGESPIGSVAGGSLVVGGLAQLAWVLTGSSLLDTVATVGVLVGIALYVYLTWTAD